MSAYFLQLFSCILWNCLTNENHENKDDVLAVSFSPHILWNAVAPYDIKTLWIWNLFVPFRRICEWHFYGLHGMVMVIECSVQVPKKMQWCNGDKTSYPFLLLSCQIRKFCFKFLFHCSQVNIPKIYPPSKKQQFWKWNLCHSFAFNLDSVFSCCSWWCPILCFFEWNLFICERYYPLFL